MKRHIALLTLLAGCLAAASAGAQTVYTYTSPNYTSASGDFTTAMHLSGSFTSATALPANLNNAPVGPGTAYPVTWSFNDGVRTFTEANSARVFGQTSDIYVSTDAAGTLTSAQFYLMSPGPTHSVWQTIHLMLAGSATTFAHDYLSCSAVAAGQCIGTTSTEASGYASPGASGVGTWTQRNVAPAAVPALGWPAMALLAGLLAVSLGVRRKLG